MSTKKAARTRRAEHEKEKQHRRRQGPLILAMVVLGVLVVLATVLIFGTGGRDSDDSRVWSAAHGHWHGR
ncbi:MAG: hypothetical protein IIA55_06870 [Gemmatimonadetes bacterium]|nr:hypothetical protein [Gemmatimonadota bacterium]